MNIINKAFKIISNEGILSFFIKLFRYVSTKLFKIVHLLIFELNIENFENIVSLETGLSYRLANEEDIESMDKEKYDYDRKGGKFSLDRLKKGDICALAIYKDEVVGYGWMMDKCMELSQDNYITLSDERVYFYKGWVIKDMRGKKIYNGIDNYLFNIAKGINKNVIVSVIAENNEASIKARKRLGFKVVGDIFQIRVFGMKYDYISKNNLQYLQGS